MTAAPHHCNPEASEGPCIWISLEDLLFQHFRSTLSVEYKVPRRPRDDSNLGVVVKHMMTDTPHHCHPEASEGPCIVADQKINTRFLAWLEMTRKKGLSS